jgi:hypothetical protein
MDAEGARLAAAVILGTVAGLRASIAARRLCTGWSVAF